MQSLLQEYVEDNTYLGPPADGSFSGAAGGAACGDLARISPLIEDGRIASISFDAEGCAATRAACACLCEMVDGRTVLEAAAIGPDDIETELGGLSPARHHAVVLTADALHRALSSAASSGMKLADPNPDRVLVAVSGGVDSAVAALNERERGAEVVAVTVKLWADPDTDGTKACCSPEAVLGARAVTHSLGIPHFTLDLEDQFRERVVGQFVKGYGEGVTPNPCVLCNGEVRIAAMVDLADRLGATHLVTGHYARIVEDGEGSLLAAGHDANKDQSYMLAALPPEVIGRLSFPLAEITKTEVREIAERNSLSVAKKPESQDLCFLAGQNKRDFLERHGGLRERPGRVINRQGREPRPARRPPQLHGRPAPGSRRRRGPSDLRHRNRLRGEHGHGRRPRRTHGRPGVRDRRGHAPRRLDGRPGAAALPLGSGAREGRRRGRPARVTRTRTRRAVRRPGARPGGRPDERRHGRRPRHDQSQQVSRVCRS